MYVGLSAKVRRVSVGHHPHHYTGGLWGYMGLIGLELTILQNHKQSSGPGPAYQYTLHEGGKGGSPRCHSFLQKSMVIYTL